MSSNLANISEYDHKLMRGITNENSFNNFIFKNTLRTIPAGLVAFGANGNTQFNCNTMLFNTNGIYTVNADLADQGIAPSATLVEGQSAANIWLSNQGPWRTDGDLLNGVSLNYFRHSNNNQFSQPSIPLLPYWTDFTLQSAINSSCNTDVKSTLKPNVISDAVHGPRLSREKAFGAIVNGTTTYNNNTYAQALDHWKASVALFSLQSDSSYFIGDSSDIPYWNFVNACNGTTTDKICQTQEEISHNDMPMAEMKNESYLPTCLQDEYNQNVQRLYIKQQNGTSLSNVDISYLEMVACLDPVLNGSGVYQARTMLGWAGNCINNLSFKSFAGQETGSNTVKELDVVLYPNPNNGSFNLGYSLENDAKLRIFDLTGKIVKESILLKTENRKKILVSQRTGVYLYTITNAVGDKKTGKFVIQ